MKKTKVGTVTQEQVVARKKILRSMPNAALDPAEEQALRMRHGIGLDQDAPLPSKAEDHPEAARALLEMEAELLRAMRRRTGVEIQDEELLEESEQQESNDCPRPADSRVKSKIIRALRRKS